MAPKYITLLFTSLALVIVVFIAVSRQPAKPSPQPSTPPLHILSKSLTLADIASENIEVITENIGIPWEILFLPDNEMLVTLREGKLLRLDPNGNLLQVINLEETSAAGTTSGGALGMALHPKFSSNNWIYIYETVQKEGPANRVARYTFDKQSGLTEQNIILDDLPTGKFHNGGRIKFAPDGMLYVTTGDEDEDATAQDPYSVAGSIIRVQDDGSIPTDNPFGNPVWTYGHRNPQGLTWDNAGMMWSTEHGNVAHDEINLLKPGENYGWPVIRGAESKEGLISPVAESGESWTWAPSAIEYLNGSLFFAGLRGEALFEAVLDGDTIVEIKAHLFSDFGRIRVVRIGPDGNFYLATSNTDGQGGGTVRAGDNKIIRINSAVFSQ